MKNLVKKISLFGTTISAAALFLAVPTVYASGWASTNLTSGTAMSGASWANVATSGSGKYVTAYDSGLGMYTSSDYGAHWTASPDNNTLGAGTLEGITASYSGKYVAADSQDGNIFVSSDYGGHWTNETAGTSLSGLHWANIVMGASGQYVVAAANDQGLFLSSDYGAHWKNIQLGTAIASLWMNAATISSDGKYIYIVDGSDVYGSQDYGATWTNLTTGALDGLPFYSLSATSDGKTIYAAVDLGDIYVSRDYGATWTNLTTGTGASGQDWSFIQTGLTGQSVVAKYGASAGNGVYASGDSGATWTQVTSSLGSHVWDAPAISAAGQYIYAGTDSGDIYKFNDPTLQPGMPAIARANIVTTVSMNSSVTVNVLDGASGYDPNTLSIVSGPSHGTAVDPPGDLTYTPSNGFTGTDSLTYQLCAQLDDTVCSQAELTFNIIAAPNTGYGQPSSKAPLTILGAISGVLIVSGYLLRKKTY